MRSKDDLNGYTVGRGKPPMEHRFQKGKSGNPNGRPKGAKNFSTIFLAAANDRVTVTENGKTVKRSKAELACIQLLNKAVRGDVRAMELVLRRLERIDEQAQTIAASSSADTADYGTPDDDQLLKSIRDRWRAETTS